MDKIFDKHTPRHGLTVCLYDKHTNEFVVYYSNRRYPQWELNHAERYDKVFEVCSVVIEDVWAEFKSICTEHENEHEILLHSDGIDIHKSADSSFVVYQMKPVNCHLIMPVACAKRYTGFDGIDQIFLLRVLLDGILSAGLEVKGLIADSPVRSKLSGMLSCTAKYGCRYCLAVPEQVRQDTALSGDETPGTENSNQDDEMPPSQESRGQKRRRLHGSQKKTKGKIRTKSCWSTATMGQPLRTIRLWGDTLLEVAKMIDIPGYDNKGRAGIRMYSPLIELEKSGFSIIHSVPAEIMHSLDIGCTKLIASLSFRIKSNDTRKRNIGKRRDPAKLNQYLNSIQVPVELPRRARSLHYASFKVQSTYNEIMK